MKPTTRSPSWPRLSEQLIGPKNRHTCQSCGASDNRGMKIEITGWIEHDHEDKPEPITVFLCNTCAHKLIGPHVRLYRELREHEPFPGAMPICDDCKHQDGTRCRCPQAKINGGPGMKYEYPQPDRGFIDGSDRRTGRRCGERIVIYHGPVTDCSGKAVKQ